MKRKNFHVSPFAVSIRPIPSLNFLRKTCKKNFSATLIGDLIIGGVAALWFILLYFIVENSPLEDRIITKAEKSHFQEVCEEVAQDKVSFLSH